MSNRYFYIEKLGCAKNQVDAEIMAASLEKAGWLYTENAEIANLIIVNSCGFIAPAREEAIRTLLGAREHHREAKILFAGCMAQRYGAQMLEELPEIDGVFGNFQPQLITRIAEELMSGKREVIIPENPAEVAELGANNGLGQEPIGQVNIGREERGRLFGFPGSAYLRISEGCNHYCSYCAIPLIRGNLRSRRMEDVLEEARELISRGIREINLVAQDLAAFGTDRGRSEFPSLLSALSSLSGDFWLRLLYIHPDHFPEEILPIMKEDSRLLPYFDLPFQHAHPDILSSMGRTGDAKSYLSLLGRIREIFPDAAIRSTFLLGYPGEGRRHYQELEHFIREARLDWAGFFLFSPEEGTRAASLRGPFGHRLAAVKANRRIKKLQELQETISFERSAQRVSAQRVSAHQVANTRRGLLVEGGSPADSISSAEGGSPEDGGSFVEGISDQGAVDVLIEERVSGEDLALGRTWFQAPEVDGLTVVSGENFQPGSVIPCRLRRSNGLDMEASPL